MVVWFNPNSALNIYRRERNENAENAKFSLRTFRSLAASAIDNC
jgi:hypothetical protein